MNRPRHYDADSLLECVTNVFIEHGYRGTSMAMLTEACGLGKQSLYNALGDKEAAYVQSLSCAAHRNAALATAMAVAQDGRQAVDRFFAKVVEVCTSEEPAERACILTAGLMEGIEAEAIADKLKAMWHELCMLLQQAVERGQQDGSIRRDVPSERLRDLLTTLFVGLRVAARAPTDRASMAATVHWILKLLDTGSPAP